MLSLRHRTLSHGGEQEAATRTAQATNVPGPEEKLSHTGMKQKILHRLFHVVIWAATIIQSG